MTGTSGVEEVSRCSRGFEFLDIKVLDKTQQDVRRYEKREDLASEMSEKTQIRKRTSHQGRANPHNAATSRT